MPERVAVSLCQAHDTAIRAMRWSWNGQWMVSADHDGFVKYWQPNMNNVHMYQAHKEAIRSLRSLPCPALPLPPVPYLYLR